jgi:drug/metabolite transporter superfamily protein YnfA
MKTDLMSIALFAIAALLGAIGQFLYKAGAEKAHSSLWSYAINPRILTGVVCYIAVMVLFVAAFRRGGSPAVLYPVYASTFIWAALIAQVVHKTQITQLNILGMVCLVLGMLLMGLKR